MGASAKPTGLSQAEPEEVSAPRASIPCAGEAWKSLLFSDRESVRLAIADPGSIMPRIYTHDGLAEDHTHWQARAAIETLLGIVGRLERRDGLYCAHGRILYGTHCTKCGPSGIALTPNPPPS